MSLNINKYTVDSAAEKLSKMAAEMSINGMGSYQAKYKEIINGYEDSDLSIQSSIHLENFQPFKEWLPYLIENKDKVVPNLVYNMLQKDIYALNIYNIVQNATGSGNLLVNSSKIHSDANLFDTFKSIGGDQNAVAVLNAVSWMSSKEAAEEVHSSASAQDGLCAANGILGISNNFINCDE
jgi:hypothetical protein